VFLFQIVFSLTRAVVLGCMLATILAFLLSKEYGRVVRIGFMSTMLLAFYIFIKLSLGIDSNYGFGIIADILQHTFTEIASSKGNVAIRLLQAKAYMKFGMENPIFGSGIISPIGLTGIRLDYPSARLDLGYTIFFSQYGIVGMLWLFILASAFIRKGFLILSRNIGGEHKGLVLGLVANFLFMLISFVTLPHFFDPSRITGVAITLALLQIANNFITKDTQGEEA
jgi:hypothetical protein